MYEPSVMSQIRDFFSGQKRAYRPKKNFIKENIRHLQEISRGRPLEPVAVKSGPFPRYHRALSETKAQQPEAKYLLRRDSSNLSLNQIKLKDSLVNEFAPLPSGYRHQSSQTLAENDLDSLYHEGVIRFPTSKLQSEESRGQTKLFRTISLQTETPVHPSPPSSPPPTGSPAGDSVKDFVKMNAQIQVHQKKKENVNSRDPIRPPPNYQMGVLPKYLREQKKEQEKQQKEVHNSPADPDCPPGHAVLPEAERLKHLAQLRERYSDLVNQLNSLPIRNDTLRNRRKKTEIEKELDKIDAGIKLFSRDKLFIKVPS